MVTVVLQGTVFTIVALFVTRQTLRQKKELSIEYDSHDNWVCCLYEV